MNKAVKITLMVIGGITVLGIIAHFLKSGSPKTDIKAVENKLKTALKIKNTDLAGGDMSDTADNMS